MSKQPQPEISPSPPISSLKKMKPILSVLVVLVSIFGAFMVVKTVLSASNKYHRLFFKVPSIESFDNRLTVFLTTTYYIAIYLLVVELGVMTYRLSGKNPVNSKQDPRWVVCLNRIIGNTIEQSFVFFPVYLYWLHFFNINNSRLTQALGYPILFLIGRLFFALGYLSGTFVNILQLRSFGFSINIIITSFLIFETQGFNLKGVLLGI